MPDGGARHPPCVSHWIDHALVAQETREAALTSGAPRKPRRSPPTSPASSRRRCSGATRPIRIDKLSPHDGLYVQYGFQFKPTGAGIGLGGGYRHDLFHREARVDLGGGITTRNYQMLQADFSLPYLANDRVELGVRALYRHNPQEDYWGLGPTA